jgi:GAF domain-containing protein/HAMP domain-containing protein
MQSNDPGIVTDFQTQSVLLSLLVLAMGFGLAYFSTRPVSGFLRQMIATFTKVEQGDLSQRAPIIATDETAELAMHFNSMIARLDRLQNQLEQEIRSRAEQLEATFEVGQAAHSIRNPEKMIEQVTSLIGDRFGYYFVAIYLVDPAERWADLVGATGAAGQVLLANKHRVDLTERNLIVLTITSREAQIALHSGETQVHNPLLPYTRSEAALPLLVGDRTFGVLDVHSTKEGVFGEHEVKMLQNMANQVAAALENTRLYEDAQQSLTEMRSSQRSYLKTSWDTLTTERPSLGYTLGDDETPGLPGIAVPLVLREQKIGEINMTGDTDWTAEERSIIEAVAAQAALALENARLVEESQASAARDHLLADITAKIWSATTIDAILQTAIKELGRALETDNALIELKLEE